MTMHKKYKTHLDCQHGWMAVPLKDLNTLGIQDKISTSSKQKGETVYLEGDSDLGLFMDAAEQAGWEVQQESRNHDYWWPGRNYPSYKPSA
jgi:hypothetical protein